MFETIFENSVCSFLRLTVQRSMRRSVIVTALVVVGSGRIARQGKAVNEGRKPQVDHTQKKKKKERDGGGRRVIRVANFEGG